MSELDEPRPGEIDLDTGAVGLEAEPEPVVAAAAEPVVAEAVVDPEADENRPEPPQLAAARSKMKEELVEHRTVRKQLEQERQHLAPVLSRLTPELQQAIVEGRVMVKPAATSTDARNEQLETIAKRLDLYREDANGNRVPDVTASAKVDAYVREVAREAVEPLQQLTLNKDAQANIDTALKFAADHGYDVESIKETYANALRAPNGAAMVANPDVAKQLWYSAVGQAVAAGKLPKAPAVVAEPVKAKAPVAVIAEPTGRRSPSAGLSLSPALAKVYKDSGVDPAKSFSANTPNIDFSQGVTLE